MAKILCDSLEQTKEYCTKIVVDERTDIKRTYEGKTYTYYGRGVINEGFCKKVSYVVAFIFLTLVMPLTLGFILAHEGFRRVYSSMIRGFGKQDIYLLKQPERQNNIDNILQRNNQLIQRIDQIQIQPRQNQPAQQMEPIPRAERERRFREMKTSDAGIITKQTFYKQLAEDHLADGDNVKAFDVIESLNLLDFTLHSHQAETLFARVSEAFLQVGDRVNAFKAIKSIYQDREKRDSLLVRLAEAHLNDDAREKAFEVILEMRSDVYKTSFLLKLAKVYLKEEDRNRALLMYQNAKHTTNEQTELFKHFTPKFLLACFKANDNGMMRDILNKILYDKTRLDVVFGKIVDIFDRHRVREDGVQKDILKTAKQEVGVSLYGP